MTGLSTIFSVIGRRHKNHTMDGIYSPDEFRAIIEGERARVDRYGNEFSLVVFDAGKTDSKQANYLAHVLVNRLRSNDQLGWLDTNYLAVLLPSTSGITARKFAEEICQKITANPSPPGFTIFTYPSQWFQDGNTDPPQTLNTDAPANSNTKQPNGSASSMDGLEPLFSCSIPVWKRSIDIVGAFFGSILLFPVFFLIAVFIKIVSPGPAFFKQNRLGYLGRPFNCWKFRTMETDADISPHQKHLSELINAEKPMNKLDEESDSRIIPLGKFLRLSSLDELPQLFNVIWGDMSLIGPRPCIPYEAQEYEIWQRKRFDTMPGLTGLWQVSGKNKTTFKEMMRLDIRYAEQRSLRLDLRILLKTVPTIFAQFINSCSKKEEREYAKST